MKPMRLFCTVNGPVDPYIALSVLIAFGTWCYMFLSHLLCVWLCEGWVTGLPGKEHASCMRFGGGETGWRRGQGFWWSVLEDSVQWSVSLVPCKMLKSLRWQEDMALNSCVCVYMPRERKPAQCIQFPTGVRTQPQPSQPRMAAPCLAVPLGKIAVSLISFLWDFREHPSEAFISLECYFHHGTAVLCSVSQPLGKKELS